jgi:hypothetical protein
MSPTATIFWPTLPRRTSRWSNLGHMAHLAEPDRFGARVSQFVIDAGADPLLPLPPLLAYDDLDHE